MLSALTLDKNSPIPLYYQLAEVIKEQVRSGHLKPGDQLPSGWEMSELAGVSRMTVRQAVAYLVNEGILIVKPGIGTFVAEPKLTHAPLHLLGFTEEMMRQGGSVTSRVLEQRVVSLPSSIARELTLKSGEHAVKVVRLRLSEDVPLLLETSYLPAARCPGLEREDLQARSLYTLLEQHYRLSLDHARQTFEATISNEYESKLFEIKPGTPMILVEGTTYLRDGEPIEYFKAVYRADRFKFQFESHRDNTTEATIALPVNVMLTPTSVPTR